MENIKGQIIYLSPPATVCSSYLAWRTLDFLKKYIDKPLTKD